MKASAVVLCNNILYRAENEKIPITSMKLQKILYYTCRDYVKATGQSPISEAFEVWQYGPVIPSLYWIFKSFGAKPIKDYARDAGGEARKVSETANPVLAKTLDVAWAKYKNVSAVELSRMTHMENSAWLKAFLAGRQNIDTEDMRFDPTG